MQTNKEIRDKYITNKGGDIRRYRFSLSHEDIDQIQEATRKDERERVIGEIEPILKKIWELAYGKTVNYIQLRNDLRAEYKKLNSLKEGK